MDVSPCIQTWSQNIRMSQRLDRWWFMPFFIKNHFCSLRTLSKNYFGMERRGRNEKPLLHLVWAAVQTFPFEVEIIWVRQTQRMWSNGSWAEQGFRWVMAQRGIYRDLAAPLPHLYPPPPPPICFISLSPSVFLPLSLYFLLPCLFWIWLPQLLLTVWFPALQTSCIQSQCLSCHRTPSILPVRGLRGSSDLVKGLMD